MKTLGSVVERVSRIMIDNLGTHTISLQSYKLEDRYLVMVSAFDKNNDDVKNFSFYSDMSPIERGRLFVELVKYLAENEYILVL